MTYSIFHSTKALQTFLEIFLVIALVGGWFFRRSLHACARHLNVWFGLLTVSRSRAVIAAGLFPMAARVLLLPVFPVPEARVHDEFSYLLLGDTLAHGRLTNPTPPFWQHFETEYELIRPTYASQYEPGQGLALAAGQLIFGVPWAGVWLSVGAMCAALCWGLSFAVPLRWAFAGAIIAALQFGVFGFWMNSYFGGALAAAGGALIFGALAGGRTIAAWLAGSVGLVTVLATRPVEGAIWVAVTVAAIVWRRPPRRCVVALALVLLAGIGGLAYYNYAVTGDPLQLPYSAYRQDYGTPQSYWWQPAVKVGHFDHAELAANYQDQLKYWQRRYSAAALWESTWHRLRDFWRFFIGPFLTPAAIGALFVIRRRRLRFWLIASTLFIADHATYHAWYPQQSASETVLIVLLLVEGWRLLRAWHRQAGTGLIVSRSLAGGFAAACIALGVGLAALPGMPSDWAGVRRVWDTMSAKPDVRTLAVRRLARIPGKHLVFVHYSPGHPWYDEWVFNGADLPSSRIVFARLCDPESDRALAEYMSDRNVWIANPDEGPLLARANPDQLLLVSELR